MSFTKHIASYNPINRDKFDIITNAVRDKIINKVNNVNDNLHLKYSLCKDTDEKNNLTSKELKKNKRKLEKYTGVVAQFIDALITNEDDFFETEVGEHKLVMNFLNCLICEEDLIDISDSVLENVDEFIKTNPKEYSIITDFISGFVLVDKLKTLETLQNPNKNLIQTEGVDIKELLINDIEEDRRNRYNSKVRGHRLNIGLCENDKERHKYLSEEKTEIRKEFKKYDNFLAMELNNYQEIVIPSSNILFSRNNAIKDFVDIIFGINEDILKEYAISADYETLKKKLKVIDKYVNGIALLEYDDLLNILLRKLANEESPESPNIDLSNSKGTEKIIMLHKLGVLDFLKQKEPFNLSTNALASVISGITGIKQDSVYPMINPIFNPKNKQRNNPLNTEKLLIK